MSESIPAISEKTISDWVCSQSFQRGRGYFASGAIFDPRRQGSVLKASCQGSMFEPYRLQVAFGAGGIEKAHCSCPVGATGHCKHVGALLLTWLDQPDAFRVMSEWDTDLEQLSKEELIVLVKQMLQHQPDLEALLKVVVPDGDQRHTPGDRQTYRDQVSSAFQRGANDWMASRQIASEIGSTVNIGDNFLALGDYTGAKTVSQAVAQGMLEHFAVMLDEDESLSDVADQCVQGLGQCLASGSHDAAAREEALRMLFEVYRADLDYGGLGPGEAALEFILGYATDEEKRVVAGWVRAAMSECGGRHRNYDRQEYGGFLLCLEEANLDDDAFLSICRESGRLDDLVDRLLMLGRLDEAIAEAKSADDDEWLTLANIFHQHGRTDRVEPLLAQRVETGQDYDLMGWLMERHEERGELAEALILAKQRFQQRPYLAGYEDLRDLSRQLGMWQELRPQLLAGWRAARQFNLLVDVYLQEGEMEPALQLAKDKESGLYISSYQLVRLAQSASETHPHDAIDIYCQQAEDLIKARARSKYQEACEYLTEVRDLYRQLSQASAWTDYIAELRERHRRLPALQEELNIAGL